MSKPNYKKTLRSCYMAFITQAIVINLAPLFFTQFQTEYNVSLTLLGSLVFVNFGVQLTVDAICIKLLDKIGFRVSGVAAHLFSFIGIISLGIFPRLMPSPYIGLVCATVISAIGGGLLEVTTSPVVAAISIEDDSASMSFMHAFYCWGHVLVIVVTTLLLSLSGRALWFLIPIMWGLIPLWNMLRFMRMPLPPMPSAEKLMPVRKLAVSPVFIIAALMMICAGAAEQSMAQWASLFVETGLGFSKTTGDLLGPCIFALMMGIGRTVYGIYASRFRIKRLLALCGIGGIISFFIAALSPWPAFSLLGCALCGLSVSILWPSTLNIASMSFPMGGGAMFALLALGGDIGCAAGPWLTGWIADVSEHGLKTGLAVAAIFPFTLIICLFLMRRASAKNIQTGD